MPRVGALLPGGCQSSYVMARGQGRGSYRKPPLSPASAAISQALTAGQARDRLSTEDLGLLTHRTLTTTVHNGETEALRSKWPD